MTYPSQKDPTHVQDVQVSPTLAYINEFGLKYPGKFACHWTIHSVRVKADRTPAYLRHDFKAHSYSAMVHDSRKYPRELSSASNAI